MKRSERKYYIGAKLYKVRMQKGLAQCLIARKIGVSGGWMSLIEHNKYSISYGTVSAIAEVLGCSPGRLIYKSGSKRKRYDRKIQTTPSLWERLLELIMPV